MLQKIYIIDLGKGTRLRVVCTICKNVIRSKKISLPSPYPICSDSIQKQDDLKKALTDFIKKLQNKEVGYKVSLETNIISTQAGRE